ncbi:MAG: class I SAM-dependent methyltransferase [Bacteroidota bacterium]|nr:class I SAM-dependent methyltransferase [Bacteroidota bacterium]
MKEFSKSLLKQLPVIGWRYKNYQDYYQNSCFDPGHYYSPIVRVEDAKQRQTQIWQDRDKDGIPGINLRTSQQLELMQELAAYYPEMPFKAQKQEGLRYYFDNDLYTYTDGVILYSMLRHFKPKRIIEAGSGHTSALMLDVNERFFNQEINLTFIDPEPNRLLSLMTPEDKARATVFMTGVELLDVEQFQQLQKNDILFIDSTHVSKTGSDVNHLFFNILPLLASGVIVHIHDVFYPFEYPKKWVFEGRNWNEDYLLRAFLMYNSQFDIIHFSDYLQIHHPHAFDAMPATKQENGGNIWLVKK